MTRRATVLTVAFLAASLFLAGCTNSGPTDPTASASSSSTPGELSVDDLLQLGIASAEAGDTAQAEATFRNVLALDPANAFALYNLGVIAQQAGDNAAALTQYDAAIAADPNFTSAMFNKAIIIEATDAGAAIELYRSIVAINDQAATAYYRLSLLLDAQGDGDGATEARDKAIAIDPTLADIEEAGNGPVPSPEPTE